MSKDRLQTERTPESRRDKLRREVEFLREKIRQEKAEGPRRKYLRHELRRAQRKLAGLKTATPEESLAHTEKRLEALHKMMDRLRQQGKTSGNPYYHSLAKKVKSLNRQLRKLKRQQEKKARAVTGAG